jgi:hypothetical protein
MHVFKKILCCLEKIATKKIHKRVGQEGYELTTEQQLVPHCIQ